MSMGLTIIEVDTLRSIQHNLPRIAESAERIAAARGKTPEQPAQFAPKEDPAYCMSFQEWAERLDAEDRRRLMNYLWNSPDWHSTCLREEDAPWDDWSKTHPSEAPEPPQVPADELPF